MSYKYGLLRLDDSKDAELHNDSLLGAMTLGIEVTDAIFASRCGLGNVDPQHNSAGRSLNTRAISAIEESLSYPLPPDGAMLATQRPDKDSLGAMAIFVIRLERAEAKINTRLVFAVGRLDSLGAREALAAYPEINRFRAHTIALQQIALNVCNRWPAMADRVKKIKEILLDAVALEELEEIASLKKQPRRENWTTESLSLIPGKAVLVVAPGDYGLARDFYNRRFPVAVVYDPFYVMPGVELEHAVLCVRWSIVLRNDAGISMDNLAMAINDAEAEKRRVSVIELKALGLSWGGPKNILSSSLRSPTKLSKREITEIVCGLTR